MMSPYIFLFLGAALIFYVAMLTIQLLRIEKKLKDLYLYTERKVKKTLETETEIDFDE